MSYQSIVEMAASQSLQSRIVAAAADEGIPDPLTWTTQNTWAIVSNAEWSQAWDYARETATDDSNPDTGKRPGVINDTMILAAVQARRSELSGA